MKRVCVIGGGPAGIMAAYAAAIAGKSTDLYERNEKLGKKLYLTGKGRCNITNAAPIEDFFDNVVSNGVFLYSALYTFDNAELINTLKKFGLETKVERGGRVFPVSDKSSDAIKALSKAVASAGANVHFGSKVQGLIINNKRVTGIKLGGKELYYDSVIVATGGLSYPSTGSTGDGYFFARQAGHTVIEPAASLVGVDTEEDVRSLAGLTLKNVSLTLTDGVKTVFKEQGELLFTHTGVSGPLVLSASAYIEDAKQYNMIIDLKPALDDKTLDARLLKDLREKSNKNFDNVLGGLLPAKLISYFAGVAGISPDKKAHSITKEERLKLARALKGLELSVKAKRPIEEAVITRGGVSVKEIDPSTMQSKLCGGLYFAGEVIDVDALTGGYNLQIAFSTGYLAGKSC
ncbi:MAG: NAD(P)/FAD-dependent oxidoreductase [Burkholderiales bacterium]